ncbi:hypothetical protein PGB90_000789 [Kerria lacca]
MGPITCLPEIQHHTPIFSDRGRSLGIRGGSQTTKCGRFENLRNRKVEPCVLTKIHRIHNVAVLYVKFKNYLQNLIRLPPSKGFNSCKTEMRYGYSVERAWRGMQRSVSRLLLVPFCERKGSEWQTMRSSISSPFSSITADEGRPRRTIRILPIFSNLSINPLIELFFGVSASEYLSRKRSRTIL